MLSVLFSIFRDWKQSMLKGKTELYLYKSKEGAKQINLSKVKSLSIIHDWILTF
jgi:hypothetical protein